MEKSYLERLIEIEQRSKSNTKRLDSKDEKDKEQDKKIVELSDIYIALTKVNDKIDHIESICTTNAKDIKEIKEKPAKRLDLVWGYIVSTIVTVLITYTLTIMGLR